MASGGGTAGSRTTGSGAGSGTRAQGSSPRGIPPTTAAAGDDGAATPTSTVGVMGAAMPPE
eukprot:11532143-Alexandrium_andersonii.AAC.1